MALKKVIQRKPCSDRYENIGWYDEAKATEITSVEKQQGRITEKLVVSSENNLIFQRLNSRPVDTLEGKDAPERHILVDAWDGAKFLIKNELDPTNLAIPAPHLLKINETMQLIKK